MENYRFIIFLAFSIILCSSRDAFACPNLDKIPDFNCDGEVVITVLGDSLAYGFGDTKNNNHGGYVLRAAKKLPDVTLNNQGIQGLRTLQLISLLDATFRKGRKPALLEDLVQSDIVILDLGRNDRWLMGEPAAAYRNLKRATSMIKSKVKSVAGAAPLVVKAVLMLPNRGSQGPWVKALNEIILAGSTAAEPANLRFDLVSKRLLSEDQIHPTPKGYIDLTKVLISYLTKTVPPIMRTIRPDTDKDDIPDLFETTRYNTLPDNPDSDGDGKTDGDEIFVLSTDPLVAN